LNAVQEAVPVGPDTRFDAAQHLFSVHIEKLATKCRLSCASNKPHFLKNLLVVLHAPERRLTTGRHVRTATATTLVRQQLQTE
jgi:hypothetical protein